MWYVPMNTRLAPFNNLKARQAVNYASTAAPRCGCSAAPSSAPPSCQILPAGFPGHVDYCPYTKNPGATWTAPDLAKAKALVKASGTAGQKVAIVVQDDAADKAIGTYLQSVLNQLGWKASLKVLAVNIQFTYIQNTKNHVQISLSQWYQDYPAASDFLNVLFGCDVLPPGQRHEHQHRRLLRQADPGADGQGGGARRYRSDRRPTSSGRRSTRRSPTRRPLRCCSPRRTPTSSRSGSATSSSAPSTTCCSTRPGCMTGARRPTP